MKDLPNVYANKINEELINTQDVFYGNERITRNVEKDIIKKINSIFAHKNHVYKSRVRIIRKGMEEEKVIVGKTYNDLITIEGELIKISEIEDIVKI